MLVHRCFTHLFSRVAGNPLSARFSIVPRLPLHKDTRHCQDCIQCPVVNFRSHSTEAVRILVHPKPLSWLWSLPRELPIPSRFPLQLHVPSASHLFTAAPCNISGMLVPGLRAPVNLGHAESHTSQILLWVIVSVL